MICIAFAGLQVALAAGAPHGGSPRPPGPSPGFFTLSTVGNLASTSDVERFVFGPATAVAAVLTAVEPEAELVGVAPTIVHGAGGI